jgi:hypothetical protein
MMKRSAATTCRGVIAVCVSASACAHHSHVPHPIPCPRSEVNVVTHAVSESRPHSANAPVVSASVKARSSRCQHRELVSIACGPITFVVDGKLLAAITATGDSLVFERIGDVEPEVIKSVEVIRYPEGPERYPGSIGDVISVTRCLAQ